MRVHSVLRIIAVLHVNLMADLLEPVTSVEFNSFPFKKGCTCSGEPICGPPPDVACETAVVMTMLERLTKTNSSSRCTQLSANSGLKPCTPNTETRKQKQKNKKLTLQAL